MACFISAGHHLKDPGAVANGTTEAAEMIKFRDLVAGFCRRRGLKVVVDDDNETLAQYLHRIQTGNGSVVVEFHLNASGAGASGALAVVGEDADRLDKMFAAEMSATCAQILGIQNRGVIPEGQSHRGRLGLMREEGIVSLLEICFIDNQGDMTKFRTNAPYLAAEISNIIAKYEALVQ